MYRYFMVFFCSLRWFVWWLFVEVVFFVDFVKVFFCWKGDGSLAAWKSELVRFSQDMRSSVVMAEVSQASPRACEEGNWFRKRKSGTRSILGRPCLGKGMQRVWKPCRLVWTPRRLPMVFAYVWISHWVLIASSMGLRGQEQCQWGAFWRFLHIQTTKRHRFDGAVLVDKP